MDFYNNPGASSMSYYLKSVLHIALLFILISITSCSLEQRLGRKYVNENQKEAILILPAEFIYKNNLTFQEPDPVNLINREVKDSVGYFTSIYLQYISDSIFLERFYNAFISELTSTGYRLFLQPDSSLFIDVPGLKWTIRFAQLQFEEESKPYFEDTYDPDEKYYYKEYELTTFGMNSWIESTYAGSEAQKRLLYLSGYIEDEFEGGFNYNRWEDKMYFDNTTSRITYKDIYEMAEASGKKHAELMTDYLINDYIRRNMPPGNTRRIILHYDRKFRTLTTEVDERFEVLK